MFTGSTKQARSKETPSGNFLDAATDNPVHHAHVLREAAAGRLVSGGDADFLIDGALGVDFAAAVKARHARDVVEHDHAVARFEITDAIARFRNDAGDLMAVNARRSQKIVLDLLQIGVADAAGFHAHEDLAGAYPGSGHVFNSDNGSPFVHGGAHGPGYNWRR